MPHELTLLCLDDQQTPLFIRKMVLETQGFRVLTATTGQSALQQMAEHHVDLVIADHLLRDTTGTEVAKEMKKRWSNVPIILLSGVIDVPDDLQGVDAFVSKAQGREVLFRTIRHLLNLAQS